MTYVIGALGAVIMFVGIFTIGSLAWIKKPIDWSLFIASINLFFGGAIIQFSSLPSVDALNNDIWLIILGIVLAMIGVITWIVTRKSYSMKQEKYATKKKENIEDVIEPVIKQTKKEKEIELAHELEESRKKNATYIYNKCQERELTSFDSKKKLNTLMVIAKSYDVTDEEEAKELYELGKKLHEDSIEEKEQHKLSKMRETEENSYNKAASLAEVSGKMKYTDLLEWQISMLKKDTFRDNSSEDINDKQKLVDSIDEKLFDKDNQDKKFRLLKFSDVKCRVLESKNIEVTGTLKVNKELKILDSEAILDGSLKILVYDDEHNEVAHGYFSAPGFDETDLDKIGFDKVKDFSAICKVNNYDEIDEDIEYYCEIKANNLWIIEK